jgi:DeoR/GlpR family transcriptional regulator of sugar metabolism
MSALAEPSGKTSGKILDAICQNGEITIPELALFIGVTERSIERNIRQLHGDGRLRRVGPAKGGHWEAIEKSRIIKWLKSGHRWASRR